MKKILFTHLIVLAACCLAGMDQPVWAQPAAAATATAIAAKDEGPPAYMLVLAGLSAVLFVAGRRKR